MIPKCQRLGAESRGEDPSALATPGTDVLQGLDQLIDPIAEFGRSVNQETLDQKEGSAQTVVVVVPQNREEACEIVDVDGDVVLVGAQDRGIGSTGVDFRESVTERRHGLQFVHRAVLSKKCTSKKVDLRHGESNGTKVGDWNQFSVASSQSSAIGWRSRSVFGVRCSAIASRKLQSRLSH